MGKKYVESSKLVDRSVLYTPAEALDLAVKTAKAKFDETIEARELSRRKDQNRCDPTAGGTGITGICAASDTRVSAADCAALASRKLRLLPELTRCQETPSSEYSNANSAL